MIKLEIIGRIPYETTQKNNEGAIDMFAGKQARNGCIVLEQANAAIAAEKGKEIVMLSIFHKRSRMKRLVRIICGASEGPAEEAAMDPITWQPPDTGTRRVGKPRIHWLKETMQYMWASANQKNNIHQHRAQHKK